MSPQAINWEPFDGSVTPVFSFFRKLQGCTVSTYITFCIYAFEHFPLLVKNNLDCSQFSFFCSDVPLNTAACSFRANSLIVSLKNSVKIWKLCILCNSCLRWKNVWLLILTFHKYQKWTCH